SRWERTARGPRLGIRHGGASPWRQHSLIRGLVAVTCRGPFSNCSGTNCLSLCRRNAAAAPTVRERARCLVLVSLVNAFTNYRNVKGEVGQNQSRVTDVTHLSPGLCGLVPTPLCDVM